MPLLDLRELVQFQPSPTNASLTNINGVNFNLTALRYFNYTLYSNFTISNRSKCYIIRDNFKPAMFSNGSWVNATTCYSPYYSIGNRGVASIVFAVLFALSIMFTLINLRKHGKLYMREDKRFRVIGRRWQWYWMLFVAACAMISTLTGVDVDRYYLQQIPIILQSFFYTLMFPGTLAIVWEATRHWGSWQERQMVDRDPYGLPQDDRRSKTEFYLPLVFYFFTWLNFFMTIPRSWTPLQKQNTPEQKNDIARPSATGPREKVGAVIGAVAWMVICFSLYHSLKHYKPRTTGLWNKFNSFCHYCPTKLFLAILILAIRVGYGIASAWIWDLTIFQDDVEIGWPFGLGFGSTLLIVIIFEIAGFMEENEDKIIMQQRRERGVQFDNELGYVRKPNWWKRNFADMYKSDDERLRNMAGEVGGGPATSARVSRNLELGNMTVRNRSRSRPNEDPFQDQSPRSDSYSEGGGRVGAHLHPHRGYSDDRASTMTGQTLTASVTTENAQPQQIRSMLDI